MKKSWKKQLNSELDRIVPPFAEERAQEKEDCGKTRSRKRRTGAVLSAAVSLCAALVLVFTLVLFPLSSANETYVAIEINPRAAFVTDGKTVTRVVSLNEDADLVLSDEPFAQSLIGKKTGEALTLFTDRAARLGFLDLNRISAVRLSTQSGSEKALYGAQSSLEIYFRSKGAYTAVATQTLEKQAFADLVGTDAETLKTSALSYTERKISVFSKAQLQSDYEERFLYGRAKDVLQAQLKKSLADVEESLRLLTEIETANETVTDHPDNPARLLRGDYWTVTGKPYLYPPEQFSDGFRRAIETVSGLLEEYDALGAFPVENKIALDTALAALSAVPMETLKKLADDFSDNALDVLGDSVISVLTYAGVDTAFVEKLFALPETAEAYLENAFSAFRGQAEELLNLYKDSYENEREVLSERDYENFLSGISAQYGSAGDFWNSLQT